MMPERPWGGVICWKVRVRGSKTARRFRLISPNQIRPSRSMAGLIMPLFAWGRGYSRKLPIAVLAICVVTTFVLAGAVDEDVALVLLQATRNIVRSVRQHKNERHFITIIP